MSAHCSTIIYSSLSNLQPKKRPPLGTSNASLLSPVYVVVVVAVELCYAATRVSRCILQD